MGRKWFDMTKQLTGRNENAIKNRFMVLCKDEAIELNSESLEMSEQDHEEQISFVEICVRKKDTKKPLKKERKDSFVDLAMLDEAAMMEEVGRVPEEQRSFVSMLTSFQSFSISLDSRELNLRVSECSLIDIARDYTLLSLSPRNNECGYDGSLNSMLNFGLPDG
jgi:hypothetical protein